jgi:hypothetical protein
MKVTIKQLYEANVPLTYLLKSPLMTKLGDKVTAKFNKVISEVTIPIQKHSFAMQDLIKEMGKDMGDSRFEIPEDKVDEFKERKAVLESQEIEIDIPEFTLEEFTTSIIPADHLRYLQDWMIKV